MRLTGPLFLILLLIQPDVTLAQGQRPPTIADLALYSGVDREQVLAVGAKKEAKIVWYTALAGNSYRDLAKAFEAKYGVPVESYRGTSKDLISKFLAEAQAKRYLMDVAESSPPILMLMQALKFLQPFANPYVNKLIPDAREEAEKGAVYYATVRESYMGFAYNKNKLPANAVPKNYDDLLKPMLKGRMAFVTTDTGTRTIGGMLRTKGDEYLRKLRGQEIAMHAISGQALNDLIVSGEIEASPTIFRNHALVAAAKKAPVAWVPMDIVPASAGSAGLSIQAPHPYAAVLFVDFLFSPEGQKILAAYDYGSPAKEYGFKRWYPEKGMTIQQLEKDTDRWERGLRDLGRRQG